MACARGQREERDRRRGVAVSLGLVVALCSTLALAASVSTHAFGRYEMVLQEGAAVAMGEILGTVRRQTGRPEYPVMLGAQKQTLELNLLGPGNRPYPVASTAFSWPTASGPKSARFVIERSAVEGEQLTIRVRHASRPVRARLVVDLRRLERMLEGER
jgi:hypothetical protein